MFGTIHIKRYPGMALAARSRGVWCFEVLGCFLVFEVHFVVKKPFVVSHFPSGIVAFMVK